MKYSFKRGFSAQVEIKLGILRRKYLIRAKEFV